MEVKIKLITVKELKSFRNFARKIILHEYPGYPPEGCKVYWRLQYNYKNLAESLKNKSGIIFLAKQRRKPLGYAICILQEGGGSWLEWLMVSREHRGLGVGTKLLLEVEKLVQKRGRHFIYLFTEAERNIKFYQRFGFKVVGVQKNAWFHMDETLMQKNW